MLSVHLDGNGETSETIANRCFWPIGTLARYGLQVLIQTRVGSTFPYGTLVINLTGCFFLGLLGQITLNRMIVSPELRVAIAIGFFGGYTTFRVSGLGDGKNARSRRMAVGFHLRCSQRTVWVSGLSVAGIRLAGR